MLNGVLGDYLAETQNPLAIEMSLRHDGHPLELESEALRAAFPQPAASCSCLLHGSCMNDLQWNRHGHDHGAALARDLGLHAALPPLQQRPARLDERARARRAARAARRRVARAGRGARAARSQHGRARGAQRLPLRRDAGTGERARGAASSRSSSASARRTTARRSSAAATGSTCSSASAATARRSRDSASFAAPASPTCASATCSTSTGTGAIASRARKTHAQRAEAARGRRVLRHRRDHIARGWQQSVRRRAGPRRQRARPPRSVAPHAGLPRGAPVDRLRRRPSRSAEPTGGLRAAPNVALLAG